MFEVRERPGAPRRTFLERCWVGYHISGILWSLAEMILWSAALLEQQGLLDFMDTWQTTAIIKLLYLNNVKVTRRHYIGRILSDLPNGAFVLINHTSATSKRTTIFGACKIGAAFLWILVSILMLYSVTRRISSSIGTFMWGLVTLIFFVFDFLVTVIYINDLRYAASLVDLTRFIGGILSGAGRANPDTSAAIWTMALIASKGVLGAFINLFLTVFSFVYYNDSRITTEPTDSTISSDSENNSGFDNNNSVRGMSRGMNTSRPRMRRGPRFVTRTPMQNRQLLNLHHPDIYPMDNVTTDNTETPEQPQPGSGKYSVRFPESLMSISQKIDKMIQHEHVSSPIPATGIYRLPRHPPLSPVLSNSSEEDKQVVHIEEAMPSRNDLKEVNSQMPWSYIPPPVNRMRDQLPADEELPPVPVPDYIVHPSYRKASVHRAQSALSRELQAKLTGMQDRNKYPKQMHEDRRGGGASATMRDADVLY